MGAPRSPLSKRAALGDKCRSAKALKGGLPHALGLPSAPLSTARRSPTAPGAFRAVTRRRHCGGRSRFTFTTLLHAVFFCSSRKAAKHFYRSLAFRNISPKTVQGLTQECRAVAAVSRTDQGVARPLGQSRTRRISSRRLDGDTGSGSRAGSLAGARAPRASFWVARSTTSVPYLRCSFVRFKPPASLHAPAGKTRSLLYWFLTRVFWRHECCEKTADIVPHLSEIRADLGSLVRG
jgi:hypothetical protein